MTIWRYFSTGWLRAASLWPVVLLLYLMDTGFAALLAAPPASQLAAIFGRSALA
ncbi:MAG: hypothetical protein HY690_03810, partial [Chloroflexi bacterium]|nr:hypothetical protein [Chloroflexota bacterium]